MTSGTKILIVDDDEQITGMLERYLSQNGCTPVIASTATTALERVRDLAPEVIVLDIGLPDRDGLTLMREFREVTEAPILMLTGRSDTVDKIIGLEMGADDYMTKPFELRELLARVRSLLRRGVAGSDAADHHRLARFEGWTLDLQAQEIRDDAGAAHPLTTHEFKLLEAFTRHPNTVLSRDRIMDLISGKDWMPFDRSVDVLVGKLRKKLGDSSATPRYILTVHGSGYRFIADVKRG